MLLETGHRNSRSGVRPLDYSFQPLRINSRSEQRVLLRSRVNTACPNQICDPNSGWVALVRSATTGTLLRLELPGCLINFGHHIRLVPWIPRLVRRALRFCTGMSNWQDGRRRPSCHRWFTCPFWPIRLSFHGVSIVLAIIRPRSITHYAPRYSVRLAAFGGSALSKWIVNKSNSTEPE